MRGFVIQNNAEIFPPILETGMETSKSKTPPGIGPGIEVLQTFALPLGYGVFCTM